MAKSRTGEVGAILETLDDTADQKTVTSVADVIGAFGERSYGPLLAVPALLGASPLGAIPVVPTILAIVVVLMAVQIVFGAKTFWLPSLLADRAVSSRRLKSAVTRMRPVARWLDDWSHERFAVLTSWPFVRVAALGCVVLACLVPPLELVPFAAAVPFVAILLFGIALAVRDGVVMLLAAVIAVAAVVFAISMLPA